MSYTMNLNLVSASSASSAAALAWVATGSWDLLEASLLCLHRKIASLLCQSMWVEICTTGHTIHQDKST